ncbi:MAG TPA: BlaI/MecI/CopY family transcriptional regulator [Vicinamibacterales bacterium]|jgi:BlaI family penicillinase repressor|nr:BlaI/MecI/CopY family transcriptional regulator [Vicinamibacterales bacterium]
MPKPAALSRREREIMDIVHRLGRASVTDVMTALSGRPAYSTVRAQLRVLEDKGHVRHEEEQLRYVYLPAESPQKVRRSAVKHLVETFFEGSPEKVVEALVGRDGDRLSDEELDRIAQLIERARREGKRK